MDTRLLIKEKKKQVKYSLEIYAVIFIFVGQKELQNYQAWEKSKLQNKAE